MAEPVYRVEYIRSGVLLYYSASSLSEALRFLRLHDQLGGIEPLAIITPENVVLDLPHKEKDDDMAVEN